jgi:beta-mannosidase
MKKSIFAASVLVSAAVCAVEINLSGDWDLAMGGEEKTLCKIAVPGDVHSALLKAGRIDDCFYGRNEERFLWIGKTDWSIGREFEVSDELLSKKEIVLRLEDCDCFCTVEVNGSVVGETTDRFQRYEFDLKPYLVKGVNRIVGRFRSPENEADRRRAVIARPYPMSNIMWAKNQSLVRKAACHAGWDWGPSVQVIGFCGTVEIIASDKPYVTYIYCDQDFNADFTHCTLTVTAELSDGSKKVEKFEIDNPPLWWPNGAGRQDFYTYTIDVNGEKSDYYTFTAATDETVNFDTPVVEWNVIGNSKAQMSWYSDYIFDESYGDYRYIGTYKVYRIGG